jgi:hypothetical protein
MDRTLRMGRSSELSTCGRPLNERGLPSLPPDSRGEVAVTTRILKEAFTVSCGSNCREEDDFIVVQFRFVMKHIAGTAEAAEIGAPGIQEPGRNDGLHLYARAMRIPYEMATRGCRQVPWAYDREPYFRVA